MGIVITVWLVMIGIMFAELGAILYHIRYGERITIYGAYSAEVKENTRAVMNAIKKRVIKKHIITNSADQYDSEKIRKQYKEFLGSELMNDIMNMCEERYCG